MVQLENNRHVCILAHVDHGKTTFADILISSNRIISQRQAGKLRFLDSRPDEQERGITIKSSLITLAYKRHGMDYAVNLCDSPGHVDFSWEVSMATRVCDGALVLVDLVEGVCPQTKTVIRQAVHERLTPILVLNKMDRLILEFRLDAKEIYRKIKQVLDAVNAIVSLLQHPYADDEDDLILASNANAVDNAIKDQAGDGEYFSPLKRNVIFASAIDGWAFNIDYFAPLAAKKLGVSTEKAWSGLFGDFSIDLKTKQIVPCHPAKPKKTLFELFIIDPIITIYDCIFDIQNPAAEPPLRNNTIKAFHEPKLAQICEKLNLHISTRDKVTSQKAYLHAIMRQWLPLSTPVFDYIVDGIRAPTEIDPAKVKALYSAEDPILETILSPSAPSPTDPVVAYIAKFELFELDDKIDHRQLTETVSSNLSDNSQHAPSRDELIQRLKNFSPDYNTGHANQDIAIEEDSRPKKTSALIGFTRIYAGVLKKGMSIYAIRNKKNQLNGTANETDDGLGPLQAINTATDENSNVFAEVKVDHIFKLMGKDLEDLEFASKGSIVGLILSPNLVLKNTTLSTSPQCQPLANLTFQTKPILKISVEPHSIKDLARFEDGLMLLNQSDSLLEVTYSDQGGYTLNCAGEVHAEKCVKDLEDLFCRVKINRGTPHVPFRETISTDPTLLNGVTRAFEATEDESNIKPNYCLSTHALGPSLKMDLMAFPLSASVIQAIDNQQISSKKKSSSNFSASSSQHQTSLLDDNLIRHLKTQLSQSEHLKQFTSTDHLEVLCLGPSRKGPNLLIMNSENISILTKENIHAFISGFQMATASGPLAQEPLRGVCIYIHRVHEEACTSTTSHSSPTPSDHDAAIEPQDLQEVETLTVGALMSQFKEVVHKCILGNHPRLMLAYYSCKIQTSCETMGKLYEVLNRRGGEILSEEMQDNTTIFEIECYIPIIESFGFSDELRKKTSGTAHPQLSFSHWATLEIDPSWEPSTEEELEHFGSKADFENRAFMHMNQIRRRKGLRVKEKIIQSAEKQRTLNKKK